MSCFFVPFCVLVLHLSAGIPDTLGTAMANLESEGFAAPPGWTIREAPEGALPAGRLAQTDHETGEILVDLDQIEAGTENAGEGGQALNDVVEAVLHHEYHHTDAYGTPSSDPPGGYGNERCQHAQIYSDGLDRLCEVIQERKQSGGKFQTLCNLHHDWTNTYNGSAAG